MANNAAFQVRNGLIVLDAAIKPPKGTASVAPILFTSSAGTLLGTATAGAMEYDGTNYYLTASTGGRKTIAFTDLIPAAGTSTTLGTIKLFSDTAQTVAANSVSATASRTYGLQINGSGQGVVNVPWTDTVYTLPTATSTTLGGIEIFDNTTQTVAANAVTATASRTYGLQLNAALQGVVNVPWTDTDTNYYPTAVTMTAGTTAGPTVDLTMSGTSNITGAAIPSASATASGVVTTGAQTFAGTKTMTSPVITTSLTTGSTSFDLVNTTATTVNFAGAATTIGIGAATGNTTVNNNLVVSGNLTVNGTTTTVNSTTITVDDIVLELGAVGTPTDVTAEGGGISLLGATNKTITWTGTGSNWASTENFSLATGKTYKINNSNVISGTAAALVVGEGASTSIAIGANGGTATILNPTVTLTNATTLNLNGASPVIATSQTSGSAGVFNTNIPTLNIGGAATAVNIGATTGTLSLKNPTITTSVTSGTLTLFNTGLTGTLDMAGAAGTINLGASTTAKTINLGTGATSGSTTINIGTNTAATTSDIYLQGSIQAGKSVSGTGALSAYNGAIYGPPTTQTGTTGNATGGNLSIYSGAATISNGSNTTGNTTSGNLILDVGASTGGAGSNSFGTISIGTTSASEVSIGKNGGIVNVSGYGAIVGATFTTSGTTQGSTGTIFTRAAYNGAEFLLKASNGTAFHMIKGIILIDDSNNVYLTQYAETQIGAQGLIGTLDVTSTSGNVVLLNTPPAGVTGTTTYKAMFTLIDA